MSAPVLNLISPFSYPPLVLTPKYDKTYSLCGLRTGSETVSSLPKADEDIPFSEPFKRTVPLSSIFEKNLRFAERVFFEIPSELFFGNELFRLSDKR